MIDVGSLVGAAGGSTLATGIILMLVRNRMGRVEDLEGEVKVLRDERMVKCEDGIEHAYQARRKIHEECGLCRVSIEKRFGEAGAFRSEMLMKIDGVARQIENQGREIRSAVLDAKAASREAGQVAAKLEVILKNGGTR